MRTWHEQDPDSLDSGFRRNDGMGTYHSLYSNDGDHLDSHDVMWLIDYQPGALNAFVRWREVPPSPEGIQPSCKR